MVFLTMYIGENEHTREPAYDESITWPPVFRLQQRSDFSLQLGTSETFTAEDSQSGSQNGSNAVGFVSSNNTTPPPKDEILLEHQVTKSNRTSETSLFG